MEIGKARAIFENISNGSRTRQENVEAIKVVCGMETHNSVPKRVVFKALEWAVNQLESDFKADSCEGCRNDFRCSISCKLCSRNYADLYEPEE